MRHNIVLTMMFALLILAGCNKPQNDPSARLKADAQANLQKKYYRPAISLPCPVTLPPI